VSWILEIDLGTPCELSTARGEAFPWCRFITVEFASFGEAHRAMEAAHWRVRKLSDPPATMAAAEDTGEDHDASGD